MAIIELTVVPIGTASTSVSDYVATIQDVLAKEDGIGFVLTPMSTVIEGDLDKIWPILRKLHEVPFENGVMRVYTTIKIDDRRDKKSTMVGKLDSVKKKTRETAGRD